MRPKVNVLAVLAEAVTAGPLEVASLVSRCAAVLNARPRWLPALAKRVVRHFGDGTRPRRRSVAEFLATDAGLSRARDNAWLGVSAEALPIPAMCPASGAPASWAVPSLATIGELAHWLNLSVNELGWFADPRSLGSRIPAGPLCHYTYRWQPKRDGSARLIESPKLRLKFLQRRILQGLLDGIPPHEAAHGFRAGRSIRSFVAPHVGRRLVLRLDLKDFFAHVTRARVLAVFLTAGYPEPVAALLAALCTHRTPRAVLRTGPATGTADSPWVARRHLEIPHLPQGAPTSPALANLAVYRLDCRLSGLARSAGADYTRYADDLVFSGDAEFARRAERFYVQVGTIALEEGFEVNPRKTRVMRRGVSQRAAGLVLNAHPNLPRREFDALKAILYNCAKRGPDGQNRSNVPDFAAHLAGRVAQAAMVNPVRGARLRELFERIEWE